MEEATACCVALCDDAARQRIDARKTGLLIVASICHDPKLIVCASRDPHLLPVISRGGRVYAILQNPFTGTDIKCVPGVPHAVPVQPGLTYVIGSWLRVVSRSPLWWIARRDLPWCPVIPRGGIIYFLVQNETKQLMRHALPWSPLVPRCCPLFDSVFPDPTYVATPWSPIVSR